MPEEFHDPSHFLTPPLTQTLWGQRVGRDPEIWFSYPTALDPAVSDQRESRRGLREQTVISNSNTRLENGLTGVMSETPHTPTTSLQ